MPTQKAMEMALFEIKERTIQNPDGSVRITKTTKITGNGQIYLTNYYINKLSPHRRGRRLKIKPLTWWHTSAA